MRPYDLCLLSVLLGVGVTGNLAQGAAPPPWREWVAGELRQIEQVEEQAEEAAIKGEFALAVSRFRKALTARRRLQGAGNWEVGDTLRAVERYSRLEGLPLATQRVVAKGMQHNLEGRRQQQLLKFRQAEELFRSALTTFRTTLGETHPETARSYDRVASCLMSQVKYAEALPLYKKALELRQQTLGKEHIETAASYNNIAYCLDHQGQHEQALFHLRNGLNVCKKALGENHPYTATCYNNVGFCLTKQGRYAEALPLLENALEIRLKTLGKEHPDTAQSYNNLAYCLHPQGKYEKVLMHLTTALAIRQKTLGALHPETATSYNNLAFCLNEQGKHIEALPLYKKALEIREQTLGETHTETAGSYNNVAACLHAQGKYAEALPLMRKALRIRLQTLGEGHPDTATSCNNLASCLHRVGKHSEALPLYKMTLAVFQKRLGETHSLTAASYNNVASCLSELGRHTEALPLFKKALQIRQQTLGEEHSDTAISYLCLAWCLNAQHKHAEALPQFRKSLEIWQKSLGEAHPHTAAGYNNLGSCLTFQGKHAEALPLFQNSLAITQKMDGELHPNTAVSSTNLALCLSRLGRHADAVRVLRSGLDGLDVARLSATPAGFDRSLFAAGQAEARPLLASLLAREGKNAEAWQHAEGALARGLLDMLGSGPPGDSDASGQTALSQLDAAILPLLSAQRLTPGQEQERNRLAQRRRNLLSEMSRRAAVQLRALVWSSQLIQKHLAPDAAIVLWLDLEGEHWGCILRRDGEPRWAPLLGSGKQGTWTKDDETLPARVHAALRQAGTSEAERQRLIEQLRQQRLTPLQKHLAADRTLPAVRRLIVVPAGSMAAVPVTVLAPELTVSYTPSATLFARTASQSRPLKASSLVALGDPVFDQVERKLPPVPEYGLLLTSVSPRGNAGRAGLEEGDVLLEYANTRLRTPSDLQLADSRGDVKCRAWRDSKVVTVSLRPGPLDAHLDNRPVASALAAWRRAEAMSRGAEERFTRLSGTSAEVAAITGLVGKEKSTLLLGSSASEQELDRVIAAGVLRKARLVHLATHGVVDRVRPERSALILARDRLPDALEQARRTRKVYDGRLTVQTILREWQLNADLVVLSACETGLGKDGGGEGLLGFAQALLQKGARSVVLSRWKVDDTATALLMVRFYENLLGKRAGLKEPMKRAEALREAQKWLRELPQRERDHLAAGLKKGELRGSVVKLDKPVVPADDKGERSYAHPYYWAAFTLLGDPD